MNSSRSAGRRSMRSGMKAGSIPMPRPAPGSTSDEELALAAADLEHRACRAGRSARSSAARGPCAQRRSAARSPASPRSERSTRRRVERRVRDEPAGRAEARGAGRRWGSRAPPRACRAAGSCAPGCRAARRTTSSSGARRPGTRDDRPSASLTPTTSGLGHAGTMKRPPRVGVRLLLRMISSLEVPGEQQHVVRLVLEQRLGRQDRQVRAGHEQALLVHVAVDDEVDEVGADADVVEQRGALGRGAVGGDRAPSAFSAVAAAPAGRSRSRSTRSREAAVVRRTSSSPLARSSAEVAPSSRSAVRLGCAAQCQRSVPPWSREVLDVVEVQPVPRQQSRRPRCTRSSRGARGRSCRTRSGRSGRARRGSRS